MIAFAAAWPALLAAPFVGSVCGVLIRRLPAERSIAFARSACAACGIRLGPVDLVPLISYAALRGRCRRCGSPIGSFHLGIELAAAAVAIWATLEATDGSELWVTSALGWTLLTVAWADWETLTIPDELTALLVALGLGAIALRDPSALPERVLATGVGYTIVWGLAVAYQRLRRREGIGMGDAKLLAGGGAWVGFGALSSVILIAALSGLTLAAMAPLGGRRDVDGEMAVPFGPCLAAAIWIVWLYDPFQSGCCLASLAAP